MHEYCFLKQVELETERFLVFDEEHKDLHLAREVEAEWLYHAFVRSYPFQDGNGRISRLLMAFAYVKAGNSHPSFRLKIKRSILMHSRRLMKESFVIF